MELLRIEKLNFERAGKTLFSDLSMSIDDNEKLALVASNGAGKSTLLEHIAENIKNESGAIKSTVGLKISYLKQTETLDDNLTVWQYAKKAVLEVENLEKNIRKLENDLENPSKIAEYAHLRAIFDSLDGYKAEYNLKLELQAFGFLETSYQRNISELSGGERARLKLVKVLSSPADLYLFDEAGNHLDIKMRQYLKKRLQKLNKAFVLVSHDRDLLNGVVNSVCELSQAKITKYKANYANYLRQKKQKIRSKQKKEIETRKQFRNLKKQEQKLRNIGTTNVQAQRRRMQRDLAGLEPSQKLKNQRPVSITVKTSKRLLLKIKNFSKSYNQKKILDNIGFSVYQGDKIAFVGLNGSGKSSLFDMIAGLVESDNPKRERYWHKQTKLLYIDQINRGLAVKEKIIKQLTNYVTKQRAEMLLSLVKIPYKSWQNYPEKLSGGEKMRMAIVMIIASEANLLILDEPTNDLDLEMIELLEKALKDANVAIIFASHDAEFINNIASQVWSLNDGKILRYQAGLKGYYKGQVISSEAFIEPDIELIEPSIEELIENYELELIKLDDNLCDPLRFSERELERLRERYFELLNELSELYDKNQPEQEPQYFLKNKDVELYADKLAGAISITSNLSIGIKIKIQDFVGHLILENDENSCILPWARDMLLDLIIDLSFLYLDLKGLQIYAKDDLSNTEFKKNNENWWFISRTCYERIEGYIK